MGRREDARDACASARERRTIGEIADHGLDTKQFEVAHSLPAPRHATHPVAGRAQATRRLMTEHSGCAHDQYQHGSLVRFAFVVRRDSGTRPRPTPDANSEFFRIGPKTRRAPTSTVRSCEGPVETDPSRGANNEAVPSSFSPPS